jgi:hypothetical protein
MFHQVSGMLNGGEILETEVRELSVFNLYLSKTLYYIVKSWPNKQTMVFFFFKSEWSDGVHCGLFFKGSLWCVVV